MSRALIVSLVHAGPNRWDVCPECGTARLVADLVALTETGTLTLAGLVQCDNCGDAVRCALCPAVLPFDGAGFHAHVAAEHAVI